MSILSDPNNSAPEVTPNDSWEDDEGASSMILPPRRQLSEGSALKAARSAPEPLSGLRIDSNIVSQAAGPTESREPARRLKVKELNRGVLRLDEKEMVPAMEKVLRQEPIFRALPPREGRVKTGEGRDWGAAHRHRLPWLLGAGAVVIASVLCGMVLLRKINAPNVPSVGSTRVVLVVEDETEIEGMDTLNALIARRGEALEIFRRFAMASQVEDLIPLILEGSSLRETFHQYWQPQNLPQNWKPDTRSSWRIFESSSRPYLLLEGDFPDYKPFSAYFTHQGPLLLLDWKATTAFGTASFSELERGTGDPTEIRGAISLADYYSAHLPESEYQSYRLATPHEKVAIWCYTRRNSEPAARLSSFLTHGEITREAAAFKQVTLRLERGPDDTAPNQWLIGEVIQADWLTPNPDSL
ncbi:MAG: hypothetical protein WED15_08630 [Akkermansiaceae bacterium]